MPYILLFIIFLIVVFIVSYQNKDILKIKEYVFELEKLLARTVVIIDKLQNNSSKLENKNKFLEMKIENLESKLNNIQQRNDK